MAVGGSREYRRFLVDDCDAQVRTSMLTKGENYPVVNLGLGGIQFIAFQPLKVDQRLHIQVKVGDQYGFIKTSAIVRWFDQIPGERAFRAGATFFKLPKDAIIKLQKMEEDYWPRQQEIQETGLKRLKLPARVARKLSMMIARGARPMKQNTVMLMRAGMQEKPVGNMRDLTQAQVGYGRWIDTVRGLIFKNPEESFGDRRARPHSAEDEARGRLEPEPTVSPRFHASVEAEPDEEVPDEGIEPEGEPEATEPDPALDPCLIPLFVWGHGRTLPVDEQGRPNEVCADRFSLPGIGPGHFACRLVDDGMTCKGHKSFRIGDVVVFSMNRTAPSTSFAFVSVVDGAVFRQVFYEEDGLISLRPLNPMHSETQIDPDGVVAMWPSVAHIQRL